jgi:hypothetical protein
MQGARKLPMNGDLYPALREGGYPRGRSTVGCLEEKADESLAYTSN